MTISAPKQIASEINGTANQTQSNKTNLSIDPKYEHKETGASVLYYTMHMQNKKFCKQQCMKFCLHFGCSEVKIFEMFLKIKLNKND